MRKVWSYLYAKVRRRPSPPFIWGSLYILMIPIFAGIYMLRSADFFQANATHEPSFYANEYAFGTAVANAAQRAIVYQNSKDRLTPAHLVAPTVLTLSVADTSVTVSLVFYSPGVASGSPVNVSFPLDKVESVLSGGPNYVDLPYQTSGLPPEGLGASAAPILFQRYTDSHPETDEPALRTNWRAYEEYLNLTDAHSGIVDGLPDQFPRMLYFSAVTITTLGFGDIVPVTTESRLLVTAEAVAGVVFIGLFLNAIARRRPSESGDCADHRSG
jgi:hypothetical protein